MTFNAAYENEAGLTQKATGDIVFSGKYAAEDLKALKSNYTKQELTDSLTSDIYATTYLYGGRLRIEDGAVYKGEGINVAAGSGASLCLTNGTLQQAGYSVGLEAGTTFQAQGVNMVTAANLAMKDGSTMMFTLGDINRTTAVVTLDGTFVQEGRMAITLANDGTMMGNQRYALLRINAGGVPASWNTAQITLGGGDSNVGNLSWENGVLYYTCQGVLPVTSLPIWAGAQSRVWNFTDNNWGQGGNYHAFKNGEDVVFGDVGSGDVVLEGTLSPASVSVESSGGCNYTWSGSGKLSGSMALTKSGWSTLTIKTGNSYTGGTIIKGGTLIVGAASALGSGTVTLNGGTLNLAGYTIDNNVIVSSTSGIIGGGQMKSLTIATQGGAQGQQGELINGERLAVSYTISTGSLTLTKGNVEGGNITVSGSTIVKHGYIGNNISGTTLEKLGSTRVELKGANSFSGGTTVSQGQLALLEGGSLASDVLVKNGAALLTGKGVTVNGGITLESGADMHLRPGAVYELSRKLTGNTGSKFHGNLATKDGATLTLGAAVQSGNAFSVHGSLTLGGGSLAYTGSISKGTTYTLVTTTDGISNTSGKTLYTLFNLSEAGYTISNTGNAITLQQKASVSTALQRVAVQGVPAGIAEEGEPLEEEESMVYNLPEAPMTETAVNGVMDAMVQADWGVAQSARAFAGTLNGSHGNLRSLGNGRTAVWANAFGSTTRQSSNRGHAGADHQLTGASLGLETMVGNHGSAGIAIGHTWNRVNTFGMSRLRQDAQHAGAFGRARVASFGTNTVWIEGSAACGKAETRGQLGYSRERWTQNSGTLNARVNDVLQLTESAALNFYGGLEYLATDSGCIEDLRTGSVQNLRGELGAGITHRIGSGVVFAEAALQGDMVRHNPQADVGIRQRGANPGRIGGSITVGGVYSLGEHWSVNAAYTFEGAKHNNSHNASVGATYRF